MTISPIADLLNGPSDLDIELVSQQPLFAEATVAELRALAEGSRKRTYRKGEVIYHQDDSAGRLFFLKKGLAKIELVADDGRRVSVGWLNSGAMLGTMSLIDGRPRQESAIAVNTCEVLILNLEEVRAYLQTHASAAWQVLELLASRWRDMTKVFYDVSFLDIQARIAKTLLKFLSRGVTTEDDDEAFLKLSQAELASLVGSTRETVNRCLHTFQRQGLVKLGHHGIRVLRPDELRRRLQ
ncbi:MAG TPA: Crp/Fnr family transcriptional regulator [Dehalococcoidia bacterium]|nr:Crp/Fnr family transcriptional regulator [Dehalococcoidia bacterium]